MAAHLFRISTRRALLAGCLLFPTILLAGCAPIPVTGEYPLRWNYFWDSIFRPDGPILTGLWLTVSISITAQLIGVVLGTFAALGKMSKALPVRAAANLYVWFFRGTPLLVQLVLFRYGVQSAHLFFWTDFSTALHIPFTSISLGAWNIGSDIIACTLIFGINEGAYMAEIVRAGIISIDPGQQEAAKSLGMTYAQTMRRIVLPQAARVIVPPLGNEFNNMLKTTSLLITLGIFELFNTFSNKYAYNYAAFEFLLACCVWYLLLTTIWSFIQARIERRLNRGMTQNSTPGPSWRNRFFGGGGGEPKPTAVAPLRDAGIR